MVRAVDGDDVQATPDAERVRETYAGYDARQRDRLWDRSNPGFARLKSDSERVVIELLRASVAREGVAALDLGCGTGDLQVLAGSSGLNLRWTGVDLLEDRIGTARERVPGATYVVASAAALPFDDDAFDVATAITLFSSIPTDDVEAAAAREIGRVLRPGAWLVWYDLRWDNPSNPAVHGIGPRRLERLFPGWRSELRSITVAPPVARRLGRLTPVAYPLLHAIPSMRSHLVGRLQCPG
jgi:SAM-dependent methyltransferase